MCGIIINIDPQQSANNLGNISTLKGNKHEVILAIENNEFTIWKRKHYVSNLRMSNIRTEPPQNRQITSVATTKIIEDNPESKRITDGPPEIDPNSMADLTTTPVIEVNPAIIPVVEVDPTIREIRNDVRANIEDNNNNNKNNISNKSSRVNEIYFLPLWAWITLIIIIIIIIIFMVLLHRYCYGKRVNVAPDKQTNTISRNPDSAQNDSKDRNKTAVIGEEIIEDNGVNDNDAEYIVQVTHTLYIFKFMYTHPSVIILYIDYGRK